MNPHHLSAKQWQSAFCLLVSLGLSVFAWIIFSLMFDEMHIISTDHQYRPGLTFHQVVRDVFVSYAVWGILTAALVSFSYWVTMIWTGERTLFKRQMSFVCWSILNIGAWVASAIYLVKMGRWLI